MFRFMIMVLMLLLALLCASTVEFDGVVRGRALVSTGLVQVSLGRRVLAVGTHDFRPGRVYWRITVS